MPKYIPLNQYDCTLIWTNNLLTKNVTCQLGIDAPTSDPTPSQVADAVYDGLVGDDSGHLCNASAMAVGWSFLGVEVAKATLTGPALGSHLETVAGSGSDNDVPVNTSYLVKKNTASGGRANRGRMFLPPIMAGLETDTNGVWSGVGTGFINSQFDELVEHLSGESLVPVLFHTIPSGSSATPPSEVITSFTAVSLAATQRRRMR